MLIECVNCGFYVGDKETFCPDCGLFAPNNPVESVSDVVEGRFFTKVILIVVAAVVVGSVIYRLSKDRADFSDFFATAMEILAILTIFSIIIALLFMRRSAGEVRRQRFVSPETTMTFQFIEETILLRKHDLEQSMSDLRGTVKRGAMPSGDERLSLSAKKNEILDLKARYDLLNDKINFVRVENELAMSATHLNAIERNPETAESFRDTLEELELLSLSLTDNSVAGLSEDFQVEKQKLTAQISETRRLAETRLNRGDSSFLQNGFDARVRLKDCADALSEAERRFQKLSR